MQLPGERSTDDELFDWFIASVPDVARAPREIRDGVVEIIVEVDKGEYRRVELLLTRAQLREAAWFDEDICDDRPPERRPPLDHVSAAMKGLNLFLEEALATLRAGEKYVVLHDGTFSGSTVPATPPVRGSFGDEGPARARGDGWLSYSAEGPWYGQGGEAVRGDA